MARSEPSIPDPRAIDLSVPDATALPAWAVTDGPLLRIPLIGFTAATFRRLGARAADARLTAETLVLADARGHPSHGVSRLRQYTRLLTSGSIDPTARHERVARRTAFEVWDARHGLGPAVGHRAMDRAIALARRAGIGAVAVRDAGHFGIAGAYVLRALDAGMIAVATGNATPGVPPTGGVEPALGTNPIAIGAPDGEGRGFLLDMATSVVALGKVEVAKRAGHAIPIGWAVDAQGRPTTDPTSVLAGGMMLPLGGLADTGGYKGYGLASAVEILTGVLGGGTFGLAVTGMWDTGLPTTSSQLHLAIDPAVSGDGGAFAARLRMWREQVTSRARAPGVAEILVAGDPEWRSAERQAEWVDVLPEVIRDLAALAVELRLLRRWRPVVDRDG